MEHARNHWRSKLSTSFLCGMERSAPLRVVTIEDAGTLISFDPNYRKPLWKSEKQAKEAVWYGIGECDILKIADNEIKCMERSAPLRVVTIEAAAFANDSISSSSASAR